MFQNTSEWSLQRNKVKVKLSLCASQWHMGSEVRSIIPFIPNLVAGWGVWPASQPDRFTLFQDPPGTLWIWVCVGLREGMDFWSRE